jgi:hypothetical protein
MTRNRKAGTIMQTSLRGIANRAKGFKKHRFGNLYGLLDEKHLGWSFNQLKKDAAPGVDRVGYHDKEELTSNLKSLVE